MFGGAAGVGIAFLVGAATAAEFIAKACSSPQTTELNADKRAPTLMKWVHIGQAETAAFVTIAAVIDPAFAAAYLAGAGLEMLITEFEYLHAKKAGIANGGPPTETYGSTGW